jgi:hypothetical protein
MLSVIFFDEQIIAKLQNVCGLLNFMLCFRAISIFNVQDIDYFRAKK